MTWHRLRPGHYYAVVLDPRTDPDRRWPSGLILAEASLDSDGAWVWWLTVRGSVSGIGASNGAAASLHDCQIAIASALEPIYPR